MKPLGRKQVQLGDAKVDCHPPKGYINWWEDIAGMSNSAARAKQKQEIHAELDVIEAEKKK